MQTQFSGDPRCGIGARLRTARERTGLTSLQAAERLRLDPDVIDALEAETFESLGAPVYVRGHLKRYAELVGERAGELQESYAASAQAAQVPDLTRIAHSAPAGHGRTLARIGTAIVIGVLVVGVFWWALRELRTAAAPLADAFLGSPQSAPGQVQSPPTPAPSGAAIPLPAPKAEHELPAPPVEAARPQPRMAILTLRFSADSWVEVYDAGGDRLLFDIGSADTTRTLRGAAPMRVVLGNAPAVTVEFNGQPASVPEFAIRDGQARFVINRSGRIVRSRLAAGGVPQ
jgi:cytoskeleton protein RodZ